MTAASGADREHAKIPGSENSENGYLGECWCQSRGGAWPCRSASGADQPTLRDLRFRDALEDVLVQTVGSQMPRGKVWRPGPVLDALLPSIEADRERAKAEAAADAYETAATACRAIGVPHQANVFASYAAALRGSTGGGTT